MVPLPKLIHFSVPIRPVSRFRLGHHNVTLGTTTILKHRRIVWYKSYLDVVNRLGVEHECDGRTYGRTDGIAIAIAASARHIL